MKVLARRYAPGTDTTA